jgi:hypothetical protein
MNRLTSAVLLSALLVSPARAGTIIKLGFGTDSLPDMELSDVALSTFDDGAGATTGDQDTQVAFLGVLTGATPIEGDRASFSLNHVTLSGEVIVIGGTALQLTTGGEFELYDPSNVLLLSGSLGAGTLSGPIANSATGAFLTAEFGSFTGGSLLPALHEAGNVRSTFSIALTNVNNGAGLGVNEDTNRLLPFAADATASIGGQVPEPHGMLYAAMSGLVLLPRIRRSVLV